MKEGPISKTYFFILCIYIFILPQFYIVEAGSKLNMIYYMLFYSLSLFSIIQIFILFYTGEIFNTLIKNKSVLWFLFFLFLSIASYFWSEANDPVIGSYNVFKSLIIVTPLIFLSFKLSQVETLFKVYYFGTIFGSFQVIYNYYFQAEYLFGIKRSFILGIDSNESAILITIGLGLTLFYYLKSKNIWYLLSSLPQIIAVFYTGSRTGFIAILVCILLTLFLFKILKLKFNSLLIILAMVGMFYVLPVIVPSENLDRIMHVGKDISTGEMSGRAEIWAVAFRLIPKKLLFGYGMNSFTDILEKRYWKVNAHNVFIKVQFELGLTGSFFYIMWLILFWKKILENSTGFRSFLIVGFLLIMLSFMQLSWIYSNNLLVLLSLLLNGADRTDIILTDPKS